MAGKDPRGTQVICYREFFFAFRKSLTIVVAINHLFCEHLHCFLSCGVGSRSSPCSSSASANSQLPIMHLCCPPAQLKGLSLPINISLLDFLPPIHHTIICLFCGFFLSLIYSNNQVCQLDNKRKLSISH